MYNIYVELIRNLVAHSDAREGKWMGNWRMEWVASTLKPTQNMVYPALLPLMRTPRLPAVDWTDAPINLNGLVRFGERRNLVSACVTSRSAQATYINVCLHMHLHYEPWYHYVNCLAMGLVTSHHTWILGNTTVRMSNLADLCILYSTLKWW